MLTWGYLCAPQGKKLFFLYNTYQGGGAEASKQYDQRSGMGRATRLLFKLIH